MKKINKFLPNNLVFITLSLLVLAVFFIILAIFKYDLLITDDKKSPQTQQKIGDPLITSAKDFYNSFIRSHNPILGSGKTTVIFFGDLIDPKTKQAWDKLDKIRDDITLVWKNYPLAQNPDSMSAAKAVLCAASQNKFNFYIDSVFESQENLSIESLLNLAQKANLDLDKFNNCFNNQNIIELIGQDMEDANNLLIEQIPYLFINGKRVNSEEIDSLEEIIK